MQIANCKSPNVPVLQFAICILQFAICYSYLSSVVVAQFDNTTRVTSVYPDISIEAATHLRTASSYVMDENWTEAVDLYHKLIERFGDKVVQVGSRSLYVTVRDYCHMQLAAMPPKALQLYRQRIDSQAEAWFKLGVRDRDRESLSRVVEQAFASSWGDKALDALAEIAFEAGDFDQASMAWGRIYSADRNKNEGAEMSAAQLVYPDSRIDRPLVEAKQVLCLIFLGLKDPATKAIAEFRSRYPGARGFLGGSEGVLADRLAAIARDAAHAAAPQDENW